MRALGGKAAALLATCLACSGTQTTPPSPPKNVSVDPAEATLQHFQSVRFRGLADGVPVAVQWFTTFGRIDADGTFHAAEEVDPSDQAGTATVIAKFADGRTASALVQLPAPSFAIDPPQADVVAGDTLQLQALPLGGPPGSTVTWSTDRGRVSSSGLFTASDIVQAGDVATVRAHYAPFPDAVARLKLRRHVPTLSSVSGPAAPGETVDITGSSFLQGGPFQAVFPGPGNTPIVVDALLFEGGVARAQVPAGATDGPFRVAFSFGTDDETVSNAVPFVRKPFLRVRPEQLDLASGERTQIHVSILGSTQPRELTYGADAGSFEGDVYVAPTVTATRYATVRACVAGTAFCSGAVVAIHPFRLDGPTAAIPAGSTLQLTAVGADVVFSLAAGGGSVTPGGLYSAPATAAEPNHAVVSATDGQHVETIQIATTGFSSGLVGRSADYVDLRSPLPDPGGTAVPPYGCIAEVATKAAQRAYASCRPLTLTTAQRAFAGEGYWWIDAFDLSNPAQPRWTGAAEAPAEPDQLFVSHGRLYALSSKVTGEPNDSTLAIYDVSSGTPQLLQFHVYQDVVFSLDGDSLWLIGPLTSQEASLLTLERYDLSQGPLVLAESLQVPFEHDKRIFDWTTVRFHGTRGYGYATSNDGNLRLVVVDLAPQVLDDPGSSINLIDLGLSVPVTFTQLDPISFAGETVVASSCFFDLSGSAPAPAGCFSSGPIVGGAGARFASSGGGVFDLSVPSAPRQVVNVEWQAIGNLSFDDGFAAAPEGTGGLALYDISVDGGLRGLRLFPFFGVGDVASAGAVVNDRLYAVASVEDPFSEESFPMFGVWDLSTSPPGLVSAELTPDFGTSLAANETFILAAREDATVEVRSVAADPATPPLIQTIGLDVGAVALDGSIGWLGTSDGRLLATQLSATALPQVLSSSPLLWKPNAILLADGLAFIGEESPDGVTGAIEVFDVSNPAHPALVGAVSVSACKALALSGTLLAAATAEGFATVNVADPSNPQVLASVPLLLSIYGAEYVQAPSAGVAFHDGLLYVTSSFNRVWIYDAQTPSVPELTGLSVMSATPALFFQGEILSQLGFLQQWDASQPRNAMLLTQSPVELQPGH